MPITTLLLEQLMDGPASLMKMLFKEDTNSIPVFSLLQRMQRVYAVRVLIVLGEMLNQTQLPTWSLTVNHTQPDFYYCVRQTNV
jgi:hypothetical protein